MIWLHNDMTQCVGSVGVYLSALFSFIIRFSRTSYMYGQCIYGFNILLIKFHSFLHIMTMWNDIMLGSFYVAIILCIAHAYNNIRFRIFQLCITKKLIFSIHSSTRFIHKNIIILWMLWIKKKLWRSAVQ